MILIHDHNSRGRSQNGWSDVQHSFSFAGFQDPRRMGFARLRVLNDERLIPGAGHEDHGLADYDVLTLVLEGRLRHEDGLNGAQDLLAGQLQILRAGAGLRRRLVNGSDRVAARFLQAWLIPDAPGGPVSLASRAVPGLAGDAPPQTVPQTVPQTDPHSPPHSLLLAGGTSGFALGSDSQIRVIGADAGGQSALAVAPGRAVFVQILTGLADMAGERLVAGDGLALTESPPALTWQSPGQALVIDMPAAWPQDLAKAPAPPGLLAMRPIRFPVV